MPNYSFKLPDLGEGTVESEIAAWRVLIGDQVEANQPLVDMMTDKATIEITAPVSGKVVSLAGNPGDIIAVGSELVVFDTDGNNRAEEVQTLPDSSTATTVVPINTNHTQSNQIPPTANKPLTSPSIRRIAQEQGIDLTQVPGSGPKGRITREDIEQFITTHNKPAAINHDGVKATGTREIKIIGLRRKIAENMALSASRIPHFTYVEEVDVTELERLRQHLNATRAEGQPKLTYLPFLMQAMVKVLRDFPQCNARFDDEKSVVTQYDAVHIGIATQTDNGLMVPVVKHVEALDIWQCASEILRLAEASRASSAAKDELTGSTITISSLGALGGITTTPVINYPEVAIIAVNKTQERPVIENGTITMRLLMNLSSSFDHRVVDGYDAARMIQALKGRLEHPATMFM